MTHRSSSVVEWMVLEPKKYNYGGLACSKRGGHYKEERVHWVESTHNLTGVLNKGVARSSCSCRHVPADRGRGEVTVVFDLVIQHDPVWVALELLEVVWVALEPSESC